MQGTIYLIHFDRPYHHARHYLGWTQYLDARLAHHQAGNGARLMAAVSAAGIGWRVVQTWKGDRNLERRIKNCHGLAQCCPVCGGTCFAKLAEEVRT